MKKKNRREINYIKVNLNSQTKLEKQKKVNNITYIQIKQNYDSYLKRNKNIKLLKENSTLRKITSKDYLEQKKYNNKNENNNLELMPFIPNKRINKRKKEELKNIQRNVISMRRFEYSMKVKDAANKKICKNNKYDIKKVITIQRWIKGYLVRSFLYNASEVEKILNDFIKHINKFIYLKFNVFKKLKMYNISNIKYISDNIFENKKFFNNANEYISISNINTNNNTNTFTNNNTFSVGQETPENFENRSRELLIEQKKKYKAPSIRELLMFNNDLNKNKSTNSTLNQNLKNEIYFKKFQRAKSSNSIIIKNNNKICNQSFNVNNKSFQTFSAFNSNNNIKTKEKIELNHKLGTKTINIRNLLFNNVNNNNEKIYKKPLINMIYISKVSKINNKSYNINNSPKSEKLFLPKVYQIKLDDSFEENNKDNNIIKEEFNSKERNENPLLGFDNIFIDEIKEVKEDDEEDDSQSQFIKNFSESQISEKLLNDNKNIFNKKYNIASSSFEIKPCSFDKKKILIVLLLEKQILFSLKPYVFNLLKTLWKNKNKIFS